MTTLIKPGRSCTQVNHLPTQSENLVLMIAATIIKVPEDSAKELVNWTSPIPGDESNYITILDVFHQLHCLNMIRRSVYPERYHGQLFVGNEYHNITTEHVGTYRNCPYVTSKSVRESKLTRLIRALYRLSEAAHHLPKRPQYPLLAMGSRAPSHTNLQPSDAYLSRF